MKALKTLKLAGIAASFVLSVWADRLQAVSIPISNHSFELPDAMGAYANGVPTSWSSFSGDGDLYTWVENNTAVAFTGGDGVQHGGMEETGGYIYQDLGVPFQANKTYRLDLAGAHRAGWTNGTVQFGLFSSDAIGTDVGTPGFIDLHSFWSGSGNPDGDNQFDQLRDASALQKIDLNGDGVEALGHMYTFDAGPTPPAGNIVVFIRHQSVAGRIQYDNVRLDEVATLRKGDVDGDGDVDLTDLSAIQTNFRTTVATRSLGDLDEDGFVDFTDYLEWKAFYPFPGAGSSSAASGAVPEPSALLTALLAGFLPLGARRQTSPRHSAKRTSDKLGDLSDDPA